MPKLFDISENDLNEYDIEFRIHATRRMFQRDIFEDDIEMILREGEVIEHYDDDFPFPSLLINGLTQAYRPLHIVVGVNISEQILVIIAAYEPSPLLWAENFSRRIG